MIVRPREEMLEKAASGVFFIHPCSVAKTTYSSSGKLDTERTEAMTSSEATGNTEGIGAPFAMRLPTGI